MFIIKQNEILQLIKDNPLDDVGNLKAHFESSDRFLILTASILLKSYHETKGLSDVAFWIDVLIASLERHLIKQTFECLFALRPLS